MPWQSKQLPPIVMLHHVGDGPQYESLKPYAISQQSFLSLLNHLERKQFQTTTFLEIERDQSRSKKQVILSFDDCSKSLLDFAVPELLRRNMKAVFYMPSAHLGQYNSWDVAEGRSRLELMDAADLCYLQAQGMEIGGHSHHHIKLDQEAASKVVEEIYTCQSTLEAILQVPLISFAYPYGSIPPDAARVLSSRGFKYGLAIYTPQEHSHCLRRFIYHDGDTPFTLGLKLSTWYKIYRAFFDRRKHG